VAGKTSGVYLTKGGGSYPVLEAGWLGQPVSKEGTFPVLERATGLHDLGDKPPVEGSLHAYYGGKRLILNQFERCTFPHEPDWESFLTMVLEPSEVVPGDWDLAEMEFSWTRFPARSNRIVNNLFDALDALVDRIKERFDRSEPEFVVKLDPGTPRVRSFLHRVDDPRAIDYFESRKKGSVSQEEVPVFRRFLAEHPDDPYLQVHAVDLEAKYGDVAISEGLMNDWRERLETSPDLLLRENAQRAFKSVWKAQGLPEGEDLRDFLALLFQTETSLPERIETIKGLLDRPRLLGTSRGVVEPASGVSLLSVADLPSCWLRTARSAYTAAILDLFRGRFEESLQLFAGLYRLGQTLSADGGSWQRIIGTTTQHDATRGIRVYVLNACESPEDFLACWEVLERLHQTPGKETGKNLFEGQIPLPLSLVEADWGTVGFNTDPENYPARVGVEFQLVRMAAAAKYQLAATGRFPGSASDFVPFLPEGPPKDAFSTGRLRFSAPDAEPFTLYSIGPDGRDDGGAVPYSVTNGTKSVGDILLQIPSEHRFLFSREGVRATDAYDLLERFPYGLPGDGFTPWRRQPLGIIDSTTDTPVVVFSFGRIDEEPEGPWKRAVYEMPGLKELDPDTPRGEGIQIVLTPDEGKSRNRGGSLTREMLEAMKDATGGGYCGEPLFVELPK
jgi:hypothetical protein